MNATVEQLPAVQARKPTEIRVVTDPIPVLDTARFEHMQRIARVMACSNLIPDSLCMMGNGDKKELLPAEQINANCFLVVNQAVRWGMDPFAVAQCVSVVHGKLCYEGKLIAAVIEAKLGIRLQFKWDDKPGDNLGITVIGHFPNEDEPRTVQGTVGDWKTEGKGSPWTPKQSRKMLAYRGAREWGRLHAPSLMLGVYSDDELGDLSDNSRAHRARDISPTHDDGPPPPSAIEHKPQVPMQDAAREPVHEVIDAKTGEVLPPEDDGGIPARFRRAPPTQPEAVDEKEWINDLMGAFSSCEDMISFGERQRDVMAKMKGKVSQDAWTTAQRLAEDTFKRIQSVG